MNNILATLDLETLVLGISSLLFIIFLITAHSSKVQPFDIKTTIVDESGRFSLSKFGQLVALMVSTWVLIYQTRHNNLTEWLFIGYMSAWAGANLLNKYLDRGKTSDTETDK